MAKLLLVALGGGVGAILRYAVQTALLDRAGAFPLGTLLANALGCLAIGFLGAWLTGPDPASPELGLFLIVGLLGGFTTFSTYAWDTMSLTSNGQLGLAMVNVVASNVLGLAGAWAGFWLASAAR